VLEVGNGGKVKTTTIATETANTRSVLEWWVDVEAGKAQPVTYTYEVPVLSEGG
jgi:hypothetical protein